MVQEGRGAAPPSMFGLSAKPLCGRYLSFAEREEIALFAFGALHAGGRSPARASGIDNLRELRRNAPPEAAALAGRSRHSAAR